MSNPAENLVRVNLILPEPERNAFEDWARSGAGPKGRRLTTTDALRELMRAAARGDIDIDRERAWKLSRKVAASKPAAKAPRKPRGG